jgi:hypothetical protein
VRVMCCSLCYSIGTSSGQPPFTGGRYPTNCVPAFKAKSGKLRAFGISNMS